MTSGGISLSDAKKLIAQAEFDVKRKDCRGRTLGDVPEGDTLFYFLYTAKKVSPQGTSPYYMSGTSPYYIL